MGEFVHFGIKFGKFFYLYKIKQKNLLQKLFFLDIICSLVEKKLSNLYKIKN